MPRGVRVNTRGTDKIDHQSAFVARCREQAIAPHVACREGVKVPGLDGRTTRQASYRLSQKVRKWVEGILGWTKTVGSLRRSRSRGRERTQAWADLVVAAYNLLRMARLSLAG